MQLNNLPYNSYIMHDEIKIYGNVIQRANCNNLAVKIDERLIWADHIQTIMTKHIMFSRIFHRINWCQQINLAHTFAIL